MKNFTLKVYLEKGEYFCNDSHQFGGIDLYQRWAFNHLFQDTLMIIDYELIYVAAESHGWKVEVTKLDN